MVIHLAQGGTTGDGQWHGYEIHVKAPTSGNNGVEEVWIDDVKKMSRSDLGIGSAVFPIEFMQFLVNQEAANNQTDAYVDLDDIAMSTTGYIGPASP